MKNVFFLASILALSVSCGNSGNKVNSGTTSGTSALTPSALVNFEGNYDLVEMKTADCGGAVQIVRACNGYRLLSNNHMGAEDFCNVNNGGDNNDRNPPNPDRNPPNPDRNPPNPDTQNPPVVTQKGNVLSSVVRLNERVAFTNTLTLADNGIMTKVSNLKSRQSRCVYQKR